MDDASFPLSLDARLARAEERRVFLRELTEIGMDIARELRPGAAEAPCEPDAAKPAPRRDRADAFARISRAVRFTVVLEARVDEEIAALLRGEEPRAPARKGVADRSGEDTVQAHGSPLAGYGAAPYPEFNIAPHYPTPRLNRIRDCVYNVIERECDGGDEINALFESLHERLTETERYDDFVYRPLREAVQAICEDLGLEVDLSLWTDDSLEPPDPGGWPNERMWWIYHQHEVWDKEVARRKRLEGG